VQSGSDSQLKRMIRRYSAAEYVERTDALKAAVPGLTITSDMIVGFPGESDQDFEDTLSLVRRVGFVALYGFIYSQRPFTPALKLTEDVSEEEKSRRLHRLFAVVDEQKEVHLNSLVGSAQEVLIEGRSKTGNWSGRTERNEIVHLLDWPGAELGVGALVSVRIVEAYKNSLSAEVTKLLKEAPDALKRSAKLEVSQQNSVSGKRSLQVLS